MARQAEQNRGVAQWVENKAIEERKATLNAVNKISTEERLTELYRQSVNSSGVRIVPGDKLGIHHRVANYWQEKPFNVLAAMGVPAVAWIFYGRSGQAHLQTQMKVMHTRVMGQFSVIAMLLGLMGFKEYMDRNGKFITEEDANTRVIEMHQVREQLKLRLQHEKDVQDANAQELAIAHAADVAAGRVSTINKHKKPHSKKPDSKNHKNKKNKETTITAHANATTDAISA
uniref:HIG1 domain-containing protein n=1 Tax=Cyclophora tenuis TaxID=216820 RepID=A0A7S1D715_CYCTE